MKVLTSIKTKAKTVYKNGFLAVRSGKFALENTDDKTEIVAKKRLEICKKCDYFELEPVGFLRITDEKIPELSHKYCKKCGCALPYKTRQNIETCIKWNN